MGAARRCRRRRRPHRLRRRRPPRRCSAAAGRSRRRPEPGDLRDVRRGRDRLASERASVGGHRGPGRTMGRLLRRSRRTAAGGRPGTAVPLHDHPVGRSLTSDEGAPHADAPRRRGARDAARGRRVRRGRRTAEQTARSLAGGGLHQVAPRHVSAARAERRGRGARARAAHAAVHDRGGPARRVPLLLVRAPGDAARRPFVDRHRPVRGVRTACRRTTSGGWPIGPPRSFRWSARNRTSTRARRRTWCPSAPSSASCDTGWAIRAWCTARFGSPSASAQLRSLDVSRPDGDAGRSRPGRSRDGRIAG